MNGQWFVKRGDKARGPFTAERLKELAAEGKLKPTDEVRDGDSGEWVEASRLDWLFPNEATGKDDPAPHEPSERSKRRPAPSSGTPVEKAKAFYQKNPQKALLLGGTVLASVMMMGMCVCAGMFSLARPGSGKATGNTPAGSGEIAAGSPDGTGSKAVSSKFNAERDTRADLKKRLTDGASRKGYIGGSNFTVIWDATKHEEMIGEPDSKTSLSGSKQLWTFRCSDGSIVFEVQVAGKQIVYEKIGHESKR